ncbi:MAG TPA: sensor histidine kinase [Chloroflexota bacterium]
MRRHLALDTCMAVPPDRAEAGPRPRGRALAAARVAWAAAVLFTVGLFMASLPESFTLLQTPCPVASCALTTGQLTPGDVQALHKLGVSLGAYAAYWTALYAGIALVCFAVGALLAWRKSDEWLALLAALSLICLGAYLTLSGVAASASIWQLPAECFSVMNGLAALCTFALFPTGRPVPRWAGWIPLAFPAAALAYLLFLRPLHIPGWSWNQNPLGAIAFWGSWISLTAAQVYRYARVSNPVERQQTKWVAFGFVVLLLGSIADGVVNNALTLQHHGGLYVILSSVCTGVVLVFPLSFALAILRYRLWAIDIIINRTVVYGVLTATVIGLYVLIVGGLGALMQGRGNLPLSLAATGTVAILFQPWRERLQRGVNRLLYGDRDEPYAVVSRLGRQLESTLAPNAVLPTIVETVAQALKLPYAAIALRQNGGFRIATAVGAPAGTLLRLPLIYQGDTVGELVLGPRLGDDTFSASDRRLLDDLAREAGAAASAVRLTADLQRSRERLVTAREEERRRLRRDLHDGLGPALASVTLMADAARNLLALDPDASADLLLKLKVETRAATAEIRRVVYALRPPALDELGLVSALREQAAQYGHGGVHMVVEAPEPFPPLPAAVEVATYRIAQEAMTNVLRHARARTCVVRLAIDEGVRLEIADDGRGLDGARTGMGLTSMRERAEELGGWCVVKSLPEGGTCVQAQVPLAGGA